MTVSRISGKINPWVQNALQKFDEGEDIEYELMMAPHPQAGAVCVLFVSIPSFVLGEKVGTQQPFSAVECDEEGVTEMVRQVLVALRSNRSAIASEQINQSSNGQGLTLPGQPG